MNFDYYTSLSLQLAVDLVNTLHPVTGEDKLVDERDIQRFLVEHEETVKLATADNIAAEDERVAVDNLYHTAVCGWGISPEEMDTIRALRGHLRMIFETASTNEQDAADILNEQLQMYRATPRISGGHGSLHLHFESVDGGCSNWLASTTTMGLAVALCEWGGERFGICASSSCQAAFMDASKNKRKRFCSEACAHRESVAAFRARQRHRLTE